MGTYVHHPWTRANLNKLISRVGVGGVGKNEHVVNYVLGYVKSVDR
jgi:peptidyl-tRNA hydrolase